MKEKKEVLYIFCAKIITAVLGIVFLSVETKLLSTSDVGDYSLVSGFISVLVSVMISWVGSSSLRYFDKYKDRLSVFNTTVFVLQMLCTAIVLMIVGISSVVMTNIPVKEYLLLTFALALMRSVYEVQEKMFRVNGKYAYYSMATIGQGVMNLVVMIVCARIFQWKAASIFMAAILSTAAFDILAIIMGKSYQEIKFSKYSKALTRTFLDYGVPMVGVWGISWVLNYADRYIIRIFNTASEVGIYTTAYTVAESSLGICISSITLAFFPALVRKWNAGGREDATDYVNRIINYYCLLMIPALTGVWMIKGCMYGTIIDQSYADGAIVIAVSAIGFFFMGMNNILYKLWQLEEKTKKVFYLMLLSAVLNIGLNFLSIPLWGYKAAALTTLLSYMIIFVIAYVLIRKNFEVHFQVKTLGKSAAAAFVMAVFLSIAEKYMHSIPGLFFGILIACCIYFICVCVLGEFKEEVQMIKSKIKRK